MPLVELNSADTERIIVHRCAISMRNGELDPRAGPAINGTSWRGLPLVAATISSATTQKLLMAVKTSALSYQNTEMLARGYRRADDRSRLKAKGDVQRLIGIDLHVRRYADAFYAAVLDGIVIGNRHSQVKAARNVEQLR